MIDRDRFREALGAWASGVTIVACRTEGRVVATTVSSFMSLSLDPPLIVVAVGPNATVRPFLRPGSEFGLDGWIRVTVGPPPLMERFAAELTSVREGVRQ